MSTEAPAAPQKINLRRPDVMTAVQAQVLSHYRSDLVERIRNNGHVLSAGDLTIKLAKVEALEIAPVRYGELRRLKVDGVFVEIGLMPNSSLFVDALTTNRKGEILVDTECRTGMTGVFACGDVTSVPYKQVVVAAGEGAKAALSGLSIPYQSALMP